MAADGLADHYQVLEELGRGSFGVVYKGIEKATGETVAIKHIDLESNDDDIQDIQAEIAVLSTCASPFVTQYKGSFLRGTKLWIIMEYLGGGSCLDLLKPANFTETHIAIVCRELLLGIQYLHDEGKIHRDVKAANVLLSETGKVKLADFGVAAQLPTSNLSAIHSWGLLSGWHPRSFSKTGTASRLISGRWESLPWSWPTANLLFLTSIR